MSLNCHDMLGSTQGKPGAIFAEVLWLIKLPKHAFNITGSERNYTNADWSVSRKTDLLTLLGAVLQPPEKSYETHHPTSCLQKGFLTIGAAVMAAHNPERADMVATLGETTGVTALQAMKRKMESHPEGRKILEERPRVNTTTVNPEWLEKLPDNTFGKCYYKFMSQRHFVSDDRPNVRFVDSPDLAYIMTRYREVHDFWHVLSGLDTTVLDELGLKVFEFLQTGLPSCALSAIGGPLALRSPTQHMIFLTEYVPWAYKLNESTCFLMNVRYENYLEDPLDFVKEMWGFKVPPPRRSAGAYHVENQPKQ